MTEVSILVLCIWSVGTLVSTYLWCRELEEDSPGLVGLGLIIQAIVWPLALPIILMTMAVRRK